MNEEFKLIGVKYLNEIIECFIHSLGYEDIQCDLDSEFSYLYGGAVPIITYSLFEETAADIGFKKYLEDTFNPLPHCTMFTIALLHELGHYITIPKLPEKKLLKSIEEKEELEKSYRGTTDEELAELQYDYCSLYIERIATKMAIKIALNNRRTVKAFEKEFFTALEDFYKINNITWD